MTTRRTGLSVPGPSVPGPSVPGPSVPGPSVPGTARGQSPVTTNGRETQVPPRRHAESTSAWPMIYLV